MGLQMDAAHIHDAQRLVGNKSPPPAVSVTQRPEEAASNHNGGTCHDDIAARFAFHRRSARRRSASLLRMITPSSAWSGDERMGNAECGQDSRGKPADEMEQPTRSAEVVPMPLRKRASIR
ncbi:hypothetical protein N183_14475 [Sinorhizobium sp. Sb3]|nr:hypothetical protein N183_14475 [Sinorhizobium sp. Sb3]